MGKHAVFAFLLLSLTGCLLNQSDPAPPPPAKPFLYGNIGVEDIYAANQGRMTIFGGRFMIQEPEKKPDPTGPQPVAVNLRTQESRLASIETFFETKASRGGACSKYKLDKKEVPKAVTPKVKTLGVTVGAIGFRPALQTSAVILDEDKDVVMKDDQSKIKYQKVLSPAIPSGLYEVLSDGTETVSGFGELLSMPEEVHHFRINGRDFDDALIDFRPARDLELFWKEPAITHDQNAILLSIIWEDADVAYEVSCGLSEEDIPSVSGFKAWNLDSNWFAEFPRNGKISFYFLRAHLRRTETKRSQFLLRGLRTFVGRFDVLP